MFIVYWLMEGLTIYVECPKCILNNILLWEKIFENDWAGVAAYTGPLHQELQVHDHGAIQCNGDGYGLFIVYTDSELSVKAVPVLA